MGKDSRDTPLLSNEFNRKVLGVLGMTLAAVLLLLFFLKGFRVLLLILAGVLVASFFLGIADFIRSKTPLKKNLSLVISVLLVIGTMVGISFALAPSISEQIDTLSEQLPQAAKKTMDGIENTSVGNFVINKIKGIDLQPKSSQIKTFFGSIGGMLSTIYIVLFLGAFFMASPETYLRGIVLLFPKKRRDRTREILTVMGRTLKNWLLGKLFSMLIVGILTGIGLSLLGVPLALSLAIFAAIISFIPNFGPLLSLIPAFLLSFMENPTTALYVVLLYAAIQAIESNLLTPLIQKKMISLPMAMVLIAQVVLGLFTGVLGIILAVPLMAIVMVFIKMAYIEDVLEDKKVDVKFEDE